MYSMHEMLMLRTKLGSGHTLSLGASGPVSVPNGPDRLGFDKARPGLSKFSRI